MGGLFESISKISASQAVMIYEYVNQTGKANQLSHRHANEFVVRHGQLPKILLEFNVLLCGGPALALDMAHRWGPVRTSYKLDLCYPFGR